MLVLTRKLGERILIGDDITVTVVDIGKSRVKLGIEAPAGHRILREELVFEIDATAAGREDGVGMMRTEVAGSRRSAEMAEAVGA